MNELLPCPFCGETPTLNVKHYGDTHYWRVICPTPFCAIMSVAPTETEAIGAWNTRAGGYCAFAQPTDLTDGCALLGELLQAREDGVKLVPERTCHIVKASRKYVLSDGTELFEDGCSNCNGYIGEDDNYCPNCGAKVIA